MVHKRERKRERRAGFRLALEEKRMKVRNPIYVPYVHETCLTLVGNGHNVQKQRAMRRKIEKNRFRW